MSRGRPRTIPIRDLATYSARFVTLLQLANYCGLSRRTLYHHIDKGALKVRKIGGVIRIPIEHARQYAGEPAQPKSA